MSICEMHFKKPFQDSCVQENSEEHKIPREFILTQNQYVFPGPSRMIETGWQSKKEKDKKHVL